MNASYLVPEKNLAELETRIEKLNKKAVKLGVPTIVVAKSIDHVKARLSVLKHDGGINNDVWDTADAGLADRIAERAKKWPVSDTGERMAWWKVEINGESPRYTGWDFVAVLEPLADDSGHVENFVRNLPGKSCPAEYRTLIGTCDHCHTARRRNETFVVHSETDGYKVVGRNCLKDFLGYHADPHTLAGWAELLASLESVASDATDENWLGGGGHTERAWDLTKFLTLTATRVRLFGWLSKSKAWDEGRVMEATANKVIDLLTPPHASAGAKAVKEWEDFCDAHVTTAADEANAVKAIEWATALEPGDNDYLANVRLVARVNYVTRKTSGVAASILVAYLKAVEEEVKRNERAARPESNWIGETGKRIKVLTVTVEKVIAHEGAYGVTGIHKMHDENGNDLTWFASGEWLDEGATYNVSATVKGHDEYKGRKQTIVNRVEVWSDEALAEYKAKEVRKAARAAKKAAKAVKVA